MPLSDDQPHTRTRLPVGEQSSLPTIGRQPRPIRTLLTVLLVVTLLVLAVSIANRTERPGAGSQPHGGSGDQAASTVGPTAPSGQEPVTTTSNGVATGYPHTDQGAQSAAANYAVALGSAEMFHPDTRHGLIATLADPSVAPGLQSRLDQAFSADTATRFGLDPQGDAPKGLSFVSRTVPVGTRTTDYADTGTKVEVWCTGLSGLAGDSSTRPVAQSWFTLTLVLRWTGGDWKLIDFTQQSGPAPVPGDQQAATADEITAAVNQFGGFRYAR